MNPIRLGATGAALFATLLAAAPVAAGPVILGGDDLTDHGSRDGSGNNLLGWLYIEKALANLAPNVTLAGPFSTDIAALGSAAVANCPPTCPGDAGSAVQSAASNAGLTVTSFDGAPAIEQFFDDLASGTITPRIIWLAGTQALNNLDSAEGAVLTANAEALRDFVNAGGGLMAHGCSGGSDCNDAYGWLSVLIPSLTAEPGCNASGASLTAAGMAAFPGLANSNIDSSSGPCHNHFEGDPGSLDVLATDGSGNLFILGGGQNTTLGPSSTFAAPAAGGTAIALLALVLGGFGAGVLARRGTRLS